MLMPGHPLASQAGYVSEDRLVAAEKYGFDAIKGKWILHINGDLLDNRPDNLLPLTRSEYQQRISHEKYLRGEPTGLPRQRREGEEAT